MSEEVKTKKVVESDGNIMSGIMPMMMMMIMIPIMTSCIGGFTPAPNPTPTPPAPETYSCPYCDAVFDTYSELLSHFETDHPGEAREPIDIGW